MGKKKETLKSQNDELNRINDLKNKDMINSYQTKSYNDFSNNVRTDFRSKLEEVKEPLNERISIPKSIDERLDESIYMPQDLINTFSQYSDMIDLQFQRITQRSDMIFKYRNISLFPEVATAVNEIIQSAIVMQDGKPFDLIIDDNLKNDSIKNILHTQFKNFLSEQQVSNTIYQTFEQWFIDGIIYIWKRKNPETNKYDYYVIDPLQIELREKTWIVTLKTMNSPSPFSMMLQPAMQYYSTFSSENLSVTIPFEDIRVYYSGKFLNQQPLGYLHVALKPANQLNLLKDALLVYRLSRSAEKMVFYVDVGGLKKKDGEQYLSALANKYRNEKFYNQTTGEVDSKVAIQSMLKAYFIARQDGKTTEVTTVGGNIQLGDVEDFKIFLNELYKTLYVPRNRMAMTTEESGANALPQNIQEIQNEEKRFFKFLQQVRHFFSFIYIDMFGDYLVQNKLAELELFKKYKPYLSLKFNNDIEVERLMFFGDLQLKLDMLTKIKDFMAVDNFHFFSTKFVWEKIFNLSEDEYKKMMKDIDDDKNSSFFTNKGKVKPNFDVVTDNQNQNVGLEPFDVKKINQEAPLQTDFTKGFNQKFI